MISAGYPGVEYFDDEVREGFFVCSMMKRYWAAQIKVLAEVDKVCRKHGIRWFADCGTLLGAVRHGGIIPWDDDMDICMLRSDWVHFFEVAADELPEEYCVLSLQAEESYENVIGRIVNSHAIDFSEKHMKEFFGCPYTVGLDIFPLDDLSDDEEEEEKRRKLASDVSDAYELIEAGKMETPECRVLLAKIESDCHIILHRRGNILCELRLLTEKLYMKHSSDDAEYVALMPFWVSKHNHKYSKELFKNILYLPFEYIRIPVPARYEEVLRIEYGDFMAIRKGGGIHGYPVYSDQEEMLRIKNNGNPFRFTLTAQLVDQTEPRKSTEQKCYEITGLLFQVHDRIDKLVSAGETDSAVTLLNKCQTLAISLGTLMENRMRGSEDLVHWLEEYCELVYSVSESWSESSRKMLDDSIRSTEESIKAYYLNKKKEVLFIVTKAKWWHSLQPLYEYYASLPFTEVCVMPISYQITDKVIGFNGEESNDRNLLPGGLKIVTDSEYDITKMCPDVIVTGYPYDGWGATMDVPERYYSENLRKHTDELIYSPCFETNIPVNENDKAVTSTRYMLEQPAVLYSDTIVVKNAKIKECYVTTLTSISGHEDYWAGKIRVMENLPAVGSDIESNLPLNWENMLSGRKVLLFGIDGAFLMENRSRAIDKFREAMETIKEASGNIFCIFIPSEDIEGIADADPDLWQEYKEFTDSLTGSHDVVIDLNHEVVKILDRISGYYGTPGELAHRCRNLRKPVMLMKIL